MKNKENILLVGSLITSAVIFGLFIYFAINLSRNKIIYTEAYCEGFNYGVEIVDVEIGDNYYLFKVKDDNYYRFPAEKCILVGK